jgi:hypothetical protein
VWATPDPIGMGAASSDTNPSAVLGEISSRKEREAGECGTHFGDKMYIVWVFSVE